MVSINNNPIGCSYWVVLLSGYLLKGNNLCSSFSIPKVTR